MHAHKPQQQAIVNGDASGDINANEEEAIEADRLDNAKMNATKDKVGRSYSFDNSGQRSI